MKKLKFYLVAAFMICGLAAHAQHVEGENSTSYLQVNADFYTPICNSGYVSLPPNTTTPPLFLWSGCSSGFSHVMVQFIDNSCVPAVTLGPYMINIGSFMVLPTCAGPVRIDFVWAFAPAAYGRLIVR